MELMLLVLAVFGVLGWDQATALRRVAVVREFLIAATEKRAGKHDQSQSFGQNVDGIQAGLGPETKTAVRSAVGALAAAFSDLSQPELEKMRSELSQLRDTSTQYDMSLQHALERIEQRLDHIESRTATTSEPEAKAEPIVTQMIRG